MAKPNKTVYGHLKPQCHPPLKAAGVHTPPQPALFHRCLFPPSSPLTGCTHWGHFTSLLYTGLSLRGPPSPQAVCLYKMFIGPNQTFGVTGFYIHSKGGRGGSPHFPLSMNTRRGRGSFPFPLLPIWGLCPCGPSWQASQHV